jgi:uncharacterized DUF497 family protein
MRRLPPGPYEIEWDVGNRDKCQQHGLSLEDIEHVLAHSETFIVPDFKHSLLERRLIAIGRIAAGRYAFVAFAPREQDGRAILRPISARYMHLKEIRRYEEEISRDDDG